MKDPARRWSLALRLSEGIRLPPEVRAADERRRDLLFTVLTLLLVGLNGSVIVGVGYDQGAATLPIYAVGMALLLLNLVARRMGAPRVICTNVMVGLVYIALAAVSLTTGGVGLAAPFAMAVVPMLAILLGTVRAASVWTVLVFAIPAALSVMHAQGYDFPLRPDEDAVARRFLVSMAGIVVLMGILALLFDWLSRSALRDLSEVHSELDDAREVAQEASETKSRFLANMSHEIRTPMNGVLNMLDLVREGELSDSQKHSLDVAHRSAQALLHLLNDIVDLSKVESGALVLETRPFSLERTIREVVEFFTLSAGHKGLELGFDIHPEAPDGINGDGFRLRQVLINLVGNAVKFTRRGRIVVRLDPAGDNRIALSVHDTGIGIEKTQLERVFDPFTQADASSTRKHGGTGLGLAICRQIIEQMGGTIGVASVPNKGSVFTIELPVEPVDHVPDEDDGAETRQTFEGARVLIVEDNPVNRMVVEKLMSRVQIATEVAEDGREGLEAAIHGDFDLILMDCSMPVMDGYAATRALRASGFNRPIVALTANAMEGDREKCLNAGMDDFLAKPVSRKALNGALHRWLPPTPITEREPLDLHGPPSGVFRAPGFIGASGSAPPRPAPPPAQPWSWKDDGDEGDQA